jgi:hypothetical protein
MACKASASGVTDEGFGSPTKAVAFCDRLNLAFASARQLWHFGGKPGAAPIKRARPPVAFGGGPRAG